ncbi:hypothetical protein HYR99_33330 [Candidatus Poribacteria bacterium]|nr:hypothetical protein [Candidatus Poribacteria bacterium]
MQINLHESGMSLSELVKRPLAGEEVIIGSDEGEPVVKLGRVDELFGGSNRSPRFYLGKTR